MITKLLAQNVLCKAMSTGADFAEIYVERTDSNAILMVDKKVDELSNKLLSGAGIRIFKDKRCINASTSLLTEEGLMQCAAKVAESLGSCDKNLPDINLTEKKIKDIHPVRLIPADASVKQKIDILKEAYFAAHNFHQDITQVEGGILDVDHKILVANSEGLFAEDRQIRTRVFISATASKAGENQIGYYAPGSRMGLEMFESMDMKEIGIRAARQAITLINAGYCKGGKMPVVINNGFGGVLFHEACGHSLESPYIAMGQSQFCGKLGKQIANPKVTAIDDGTIRNAWGSINIDDEGNPAQRNVLIENGILKTYMVDKLNGLRLDMKPTGNCRRQGYGFVPTSRMTNTFIENGTDKNDDIIKSMELGLFCKTMGGGSVNPATGEFNFGVTEAYMVRNGEMKEAVRGASLIGKGSDVLMDIDMVGQNCECEQGMCGASSGSVPTNCGQPMVRISSMTVGGR